jgi:hypothetical protein
MSRFDRQLAEYLKQADATMRRPWPRSNGRTRPIAWDHLDGLHDEEPDPDCAACDQDIAADRGG